MTQGHDMTEALSDELAKLRALAEAATRGPWAVFLPKKTGGALGDAGDRGIDASGTMIGEMWEHCPARSNSDGYRENAQANAEYVVACSPDRILRLLDAIASDRAEIARLKGNQRTKGTVEICEGCGELYRDYQNGDPGANKRSATCKGYRMDEFSENPSPQLPCPLHTPESP